MRAFLFYLVSILVGGLFFAFARWLGNDYLFFAGYTGYINFGTGAFFAIGAYTTVVLHNLHAKPALMQDWLGVALHKLAAGVDRFFPESLASIANLILPLNIPTLIILGGIVSGLIGLGTGYLTLRLRGVFFAIATLALAVVLQTLIVNWSFVGGSRGAYVIPANTVPVFGPYIQYLFALMLLLVIVALTSARLIERSSLGVGFATIRDDELAAEACGVPTLKLKLIATVLSGALMGMAGAPFPFYIGYTEPGSVFDLGYAINSIAMPMIGGTGSWIGPLIGAMLLGSIQEVARVTISSAVNLLIVGLLLIGFVIVAPSGIVGLWQSWFGKRSKP